MRHTAVAVLVALALLCAASADAATTSPISTTWVTNAPVHAVQMDSQGRTYLGGDFTEIGPRTGFAISLTDSAATPAAGFPEVNGPVDAAISDGAGGYFIGGEFNSVGGQTHNFLAHILANGTVDPAWNPAPNNFVRALSLSGGSLFIGGDFTQVNQLSRPRLAKLSASDGTLDPTFLPSPISGGSVFALAVVGSNVYAGGSFLAVQNGFGYLDGFDASTGAVRTDWTPGVMGSLLGGKGVAALAVSGTSLFVGGDFTTVHGDTRNGLAKIDTAGDGTEDATWNPGAAGTTVNALLMSANGLYVGGGFGSIGGQTRVGLALLSPTGSGSADANWNPGVDNFGVVNALALSGSDLIVGGKFLKLGTQSRAGLGKVPATGTVTDANASWDPNPDNPTNAIAANGTNILAGGTFSSAGPQVTSRSGVARLNPDGTLDTSWKVDVDAAVRAMVLNGNDLYVGGGFHFVSGAAHPLLAKLSTTGGGSSDASFPWVDSPTGGEVDALALSGNALYVGGTFTGATVGTGTPTVGPTRTYLVKIGTDGTVDPTWNPVQSGSPGPFSGVLALAATPTDVFAGGAFTASFNTSGGTATVQALAKLSPAGAGYADPTWSAYPSEVPNSPVLTLVATSAGLYAGGLFTIIGGASRNRLALLSTTGTGDADPNWNPNVTGGPVFSLLPAGDQLYVGGPFTNVGGQPRIGGLARVSLTGTGAVDPAFAPAGGSTIGGSSGMAATADELLVGGAFNGFGPLSTTGVAIFDLTPPTLNITLPADGGRYRQRQNPAAAYTCADPGPGAIASCAGTVAVGAGIDTALPGPHSFTVTATDTSGNQTSKTVNYTVDNAAPTIAVTTPAAGAIYNRGQVVHAAYSCDDPDGATDVTACAGPVVSGAAIDTATSGIHNFVVKASDIAGNPASTTVTYIIVDTTPPVISKLKVTPSSFKAAKSGATTAATKKSTSGARVTYTLSEKATVTFTVLKGAGKKARKVGSFTLSGKQGAKAFTFRGRLSGKTMRPGSYTFSVVAVDPANNKSKAVTAKFKIKR